MCLLGEYHLFRHFNIRYQSMAFLVVLCEPELGSIQRVDHTERQLLAVAAIKVHANILVESWTRGFVKSQLHHITASPKHNLARIIDVLVCLLQ